MRHVTPDGKQTPMSFGTIEFAIRDGFARLALARPDVMNCFNAAMHAEVRDALDASAADPGCRALLLTGSGRGFCAGQDLSDRRRDEGDAPPDLGESLEANYNPLIRRLRSLPFPGWTEWHSLLRHLCAMPCEKRTSSVRRRTPQRPSFTPAMSYLELISMPSVLSRPECAKSTVRSYAAPVS